MKVKVQEILNTFNRNFNRENWVYKALHMKYKLIQLEYFPGYN